MARRWWRTGVVEIRYAASPSSLARAAARYVPELRGLRRRPRTGRDPGPGARPATARLSTTSSFPRPAQTLHVRNAPSPAATSSLAIAAHVVDRASEWLRPRPPLTYTAACASWSPATTATSAACSCPMLLDAGHEVVGLDTYLYEGCDFGDERVRARCPRSARTSATWSPSDLEGFDAVLHLAALSNDPIGRPEPRLHVRDQPPRLRDASPRRPSDAGVAALRVRLLVQPLRRRGPGLARRDGRVQPRDRRTASRRCCPSATSPRSPTTTSARSSCATRPRTGSRPAIAATWSSTT